MPENNTTDLKSFNYLESGEITFSNISTTKTVNKLDAGSYIITYLDYPHNKVSLTQDTDAETNKLHSYPDKEKIDKLFKEFFNPTIKDTIKKLGFYHKIGILLHGVEGTGKSTIIKHYSRGAILEHGAVVFHIKRIDHMFFHCWDFIRNIRRVQDNPIIVIFEEFDAWLNAIGNESYLKTVLDGHMSIDNCIFFASTNYLDRIPEAIKNRQSRFKYSLNIEGISKEEEVCEILQSMIGDLFSENDIKTFAKDLKGLTLDNIKQFSIDKIMNLETFAKKKNKIGFGQFK